MKIRNTVILFGIFAAALLTFAAFQWLGIKTGDEAKHAERYVFPSLNPYVVKKDPEQPKDPLAQPKAKGPQQAQPEEFTRMVIERGRQSSKSEKLEFNRVSVGKTSRWALVAPVKVRTDDNAVTSLIRSLISLEKQKTRESGRDLSKFGLDKPDTTVTLTRGDKDYTLSLGSTGPATKDPVYYAISSDWPSKPFVLTKSKFEKIFDEINAFREKSLITSSFGHTAIKLGGTARSPMELIKDKEWMFKEPQLGEADTAATDELSRQLSGIKIEKNEDFISDNTDDAKLAQFGLTEDKPAYSFTLTQSAIDPKDNPIVERILVGSPDDTATRQAAQVRTAALVVESLSTPTGSLAAYVAREKQKVEPTHYYARVAGDKTVARISAKNLPFLQKTADELRSRTLAKIDNSKVDVAQIKTGGENLRIYRPDLAGAASWDLYTEGKARVKCQPQAIQNLLEALTKIEIKDVKAFLDDDAKIKAWFGNTVIDLGLDKPQAEVAVWLEGILRNKENKPEGTGEPKLKEELKGKPHIKFFVGRRDDQRKVTYVRREVPGVKPVILAVPDPFITGDASVGAMQAGAVPPDGRKTYSISSLAGLGYLAYRDRSLPSYKPDQIESVEIKRGNITYLMERIEGKDESGNLTTNWKLKQPVEGAPNLGVPDYIISSLMSTSSDKLVADQAAAKDLDETYGLVKSPMLQVIVKTKPEVKPADAQTKDAPKPAAGGTYTYTIGKKLADTSKFPGHYYARVEAKLADGSTPDANQFVLAVPTNYVQSLDVELRNSSVFPEDKTKPASMTLTWHGETAEKKPLTSQLELALVNEQWEVRKLIENGADVKTKLPKLDQSKVSALLRYGPQPAPGGPSLNPWMVDRFIQHAGAVDPKYRLDAARTDHPPRLMIDVKYSDGKNRTVILGDSFKTSESQLALWSGASFYYAATPALPGAVMLVNEQTWQPLVNGFSYFGEAPPKPKQ